MAITHQRRNLEGHNLEGSSLEGYNLIGVHSGNHIVYISNMFTSTKSFWQVFFTIMAVKLLSLEMSLKEKTI